MADACCINAYDLCGSYIGILKTLKSEDIGQDVCYCIPDVDNREPQYITYIDKNGCQCCLENEREIIINTFPGEIKNINLTPLCTCIGLKWSEIYGGNWCKTMVRYKIGSYPTDTTDGILAIEETQQNTYCSSAYCISGLTKGCTYYLKAFGIDNDGEVINSNCGNIYLPTFTYRYFGYTGAQQSIVLDAGTYKLEVRGAQGGRTYGGKGGYSVGCITLNSTVTVYVYVGGCGNTLTSAGCITGGWNGGGGGWYCSYQTGSGGGGTDIRIGGNTLYHRRIVAGGGGGGGYYNQNGSGGVGGGTTGGTGSNNGAGWSCGTGGTQTAGGGNGNSNICCVTGGSFGQGGCHRNWCYYGGAGGGGGWYGGGPGGSFGMTGGGGSGYVYNSSTCSSAPSGYCHCTSYYLSNSYTCCGATSFPAPNGSTETGHSGHGCAKISKV